MDSVDILLERFGPAVYRFIVSRIGMCDDADDIYQTVFLRLFEKKPTFRDKRAALSWLLKTARNLTVDYFNERKKTVPITEDIVYPDTKGDIYELIAMLDESYREVVYLFYQEDLSVKEIARITGISSGAVRTRLTRARKKLREALK